VEDAGADSLPHATTPSVAASRLASIPARAFGIVLIFDSRQTV
jgi:hypothetical protein